VRNNLFNPLIISLLFAKNELYYLELILDKGTADSWPPGYYEEILLVTDRFYRIKNKLLKFFTEEEIEYILYRLDKNGGNC
jgi:hypothetical protein